MSVESEIPEVKAAEVKSKPARQIKPADEESRPERKSPSSLSEKERKRMVERHSLDELIERFGRWPTYILLLRETAPGKSGSFVVGAGVISGVVVAITYYLRH